MVTITFFLICIQCVFFARGKIAFTRPEQIHLSFGDNVSEIVVSWVTYNDTKISLVEYGIGGFIKTASSSPQQFIDGGNEQTLRFVHSVKLTNLLPEKTYIYHCGSDLGWSAEFSFKTLRSDSNWSPHLAFFGDLGNENAQSLPRLQKETQQGMYDAILHVGDFAYDMNTDNARVGDEFMRQIESVAAYLPYMTCPGNHEEAYNFSNYRMRFNMPNGPDRLYYSFDIGPAHIISINTEYYYFLNYGIKSLILQYVWLEKDLIEATKPEKRNERPWIIVMGHRPMYCTDDDGDDCTYDEDIIRIGLPFIKMFGLEKLFYDYGVDLLIWAHEHSYERLWAVYDKKVYNGTVSPYTNPGAPVHVISGSAGCKENVDKFGDLRPWSALRSSDYGYGRLKIYNETHLHLEQVSDDKEGEVIDQIWIIKDQHGFYNAT